MRPLSIKTKILYFTGISLCIVLSWVVFREYRDVPPNLPEPDYSIAGQMTYSGFSGNPETIPWGVIIGFGLKERD